MAKKFRGEPQLSDFAKVDEDLSPIKDGEYLVEAVCWSVDPYNRAYVRDFPDGTPMIGFQVAKVLESKHPTIKVGTHVVGHLGWRTHTVVTKANGEGVYPLPSIEPLPLTAAIGILGMPGMTAYFGFLDICQPKAGETVVVNAAAGAVGSAVGQIAKIKGCRVIGYAGEDDKIAWMKNELGFDYAYNYKKVDLDKSLKEAAPNGVDCFFDNVGGEFAVTVYNHLNRYARVSQCGAISQYNKIEKTLLPDFLWIIVSREITLRGFIISTWAAQWPKGIAQMAQWIKEGKLKYKETKFSGFDQMPTALIDLLNGKTTGKAVITA